MIQVRVLEEHIRVPVRVTPRGGKDCVLPHQAGDTTIKLKVSAPPEDGKANAAVIQLVAAVLGVAKSRVNIERGQQARDKQVSISLQSPAELEPLLQRLAVALQSTTEACLQTEKGPN
jgi:uncharacterized protein (TIGR00251 family)